MPATESYGSSHGIGNEETLQSELCRKYIYIADDVSIQRNCDYISTGRGWLSVEIRIIYFVVFFIRDNSDYRAVDITQDSYL
jgi:hypothetical protein